MKIQSKRRGSLQGISAFDWHGKEGGDLCLCARIQQAWVQNVRSLDELNLANIFLYFHLLIRLQKILEFMSPIPKHVFAQELPP